jgi:hypothetical protein
VLEWQIKTHTSWLFVSSVQPLSFKNCGFKPIYYRTAGCTLFLGLTVHQYATATYKQLDHAYAVTCGQTEANVPLQTKPHQQYTVYTVPQACTHTARMIKHQNTEPDCVSTDNMFSMLKAYTARD